MLRLAGLAVAVFVLSPALQSQCLASQDHRSDKKRGVLAERIVLNGTRTVDSSEMSDIIGKLSGSCFDEQDDDVADYIADEFKQRGYLRARAEHIQVRPSDSLSVPKPVTIEADVAEGPLYRFGEIRFEGNSAFSAEELANGFPLKAGSIYSSTRVRSGFIALRDLYSSSGYVDVSFSPDVEVQSDVIEHPKASVKVKIVEGKQYHMGKLQIAGSQDQVTALQSRWSLEEGTPFDGVYPHRFIEQNKDVLPAGFDERQGVRTYRDCRDATVTVAITLDWRAAPTQPLSEIDCTKPPSAGR